MADIFHQYAQDATIHGLKDISKNWAKAPLRTFCICCQLICMTAMCYHMALIIQGYTHQPTSIQTTTVTSKSYAYPAMTFCPRHWLNVTKFYELGTPRNALLYALSLLRNVRIDEPIVNIPEAEKQLYQFMHEKNIDSYFRLFLILANDFTNSSLFCQECSEWPPRKIVTEDGVCYFITFRDYVSSFLAINEPRLTYNPIIYHPMQDISILKAFSTKDVTETLYVGTHVNDFFALEPIFLSLDNTYSLRITPMRHVFIDDSSSPCQPKEPDQSNLMCEAYCHEQNIGQLCNIPRMLGFFYGSPTAGPSKPGVSGGPRLWSSLAEDPQYYDDEIRACESYFQSRTMKCEDLTTCPQPCEKMTYSTTVTGINTRHLFQDLYEASLTLVVSYQVRTGIIEEHEIRTYTWYSFLSNVGGVMGLWCGASLISMYQLTLFFGKELAHFCFRWKSNNRVSDLSSKSRNSVKYLNGVIPGKNSSVLVSVDSIPSLDHEPRRILGDGIAASVSDHDKNTWSRVSSSWDEKGYDNNAYFILTFDD